MFLPAGELHAYLHGTAVELMASSDNVLRGGFTAKHVDVPELVRVLDFGAANADVLVAAPGADGVRWYPEMVADFRLGVVDSSGGDARSPAGAARMLFCTVGSAVVEAGDTLVLEAGESAFLPAGDNCVLRPATPSTQVFIATTGSAGQT